MSTNGTMHHVSPPDLDGIVVSENGTAPSVATHAPPYDSELFRSYLLNLLPPVIGANPLDLESLFDGEFEEKVSRFASEAGGVVYVVKVKEESEGALRFLVACWTELTNVLFWVQMNRSRRLHIAWRRN